MVVSARSNAYLFAMSRAFTTEENNEAALADIGERPVSPHRNLVTRQGLERIEAEIAELREALAKAEASSDRERIAFLSRDLRYWTVRRETAEQIEPDAGGEVVRFGLTVTIEDEDGKSRSWRIVGEDEADASRGSISHASPMAQALFGKKVGEIAKVSGREWEVTRIR